MPIRFILVAPSHPGNVGAAARAMKTMGVEELWLVAPAQYPHPEATALASSAADLLDRATVVDTLSEAVQGCTLVLGTSARLRTALYWPVMTPREAAPKLLEAAVDGPVAVVFGTERTGLTNADFERCNALIHIPANPAYESLNLSQAVQIVAYELRCAMALPRPEARRLVPLAPAEELDRLNAHMGQVLAAVAFTDRAGGGHLERRFARIFGRAELDCHEVNMLRGLLASVLVKARGGAES
ncbi:MAG: RNA methyltransferase [Pseudomonadota bacterium]